MISIIQLLQQNGIRKDNIQKIRTALCLANCQQSSFDSLLLGVQYIGYRFNYAMNPYIDEQEESKEEQQNKSENPQEQTKKKKKKKISLPLTASEQKLKDEFIKLVSDYIKALPCFTSKLTEQQQAQIIEELNQYIERKKGAPLGKAEYIKKNNPSYMCDYLINNFNVVNVNYNGIETVGYWNGQTYQLGEQAFNTLTTLILNVEYVNPLSKLYKQTLNTKSLYEMLKNSLLETRNIAPPYYIPCLNGIVYFNERDPKDMKLLHFTPDIVTIYQYLGYYSLDISDKVKTKLNRYIDLVCNKDNDPNHYQDIKNRIFEFGSTILFRGQRFKCFGFVHGDIDGGKTKFITRFLLSILSSELIGHLPFDRFDKDFALSELLGKLANFSDESNYSKNAERGNRQQDCTKNLLAGEVVQSNKKHQNDINFIADARLIVASNHYLNITQPSTEAKLLYIPFLNKLNKPEHRDFYPSGNDQEEKDFIFMFLLQYLQQIFENYNKTGKYFSQSDYIDKLQREAEQQSNICLELISKWIEAKDPMKEYPLGKHISDATISKMRIEYYNNQFRSYLLDRNSTDRITDKDFKHNFIKASGFHEVKAKDTSYKNETFSILIPNEYKGTKTPKYTKYKELIQFEQASAKALNDDIRKNTDDAIERYQQEHIDNPFDPEF